MIEQGLFKRHFVGRDGFVWWIGQIADDSWTKNLQGSKPRNTPVADQPGFGYRYQVRIMGYHTADDNALTDQDLPWAAVMYPVTSGGGGDAAFETPALRKGNFVYGFFLDGEDAQQPVIIGILGYNQYQTIYSQKPAPFSPFRGYNNTSPIANYAILSDKESNPIPGIGGGEKSDNADRGVGVPSSGQNNNGAREIEPEGKNKDPIPLSFVCQKSKSPGQIQKDIQKMIQDIQNAKKGLKNFKKSLTHPIQFEGKQLSIEEYVQLKVDRAAKEITKWIKDRIAEVQAYQTRKINNAMKDIYFLLYPDKQSDAKAAVETAMDLLACLFKKIIKNLLNIVRKALLSIVDRFINTPLCAAENILAAIIGKLSGLINSAVSAIMGPVNAVLGVVDIAGDVLSFVEQILTFLSCEEQPECPEVESWSLWDGADIPSATFDPTSLINKVRDFASNVTQAIDPDSFDFDFNFGDVFTDTCNINAILCGPPNVVFWGGSGSGATANVIVSSIGDILGVDIINSGSGYGIKSPFLNFEDACGKGVGASGTVVVGPVSKQDDGTYQPDPNGNEVGVTGVIIEDSGYGYLPVPDGSQGGDGRVWAEANQTTVKRSDGTWEIPYDPGEIIDLLPGDIIRTPIGSVTELPDGTIIPGGSDFTINSPATTTAAVTSSTSITTGDYPIKDNEQYPVILYMCDAIIKNPGIAYQEGDKVIIEPSYGAEIVPRFNQFGQIISLEITSSGEGFQRVPQIYIESETGFNAEIIPRFCIDRVGVDEVAEPTSQDKIISVIDCVGKV